MSQVEGGGCLACPGSAPGVGAEEQQKSVGDDGKEVSRPKGADLLGFGLFISTR